MERTLVNSGDLYQLSEELDWQVCSTGQLGDQWYLEDFDPIMDIPNQRYFTGGYSGDVTEASFNDLVQFVVDHHLVLKPEKIFSWEEVPLAHQYLESSHSFGKIIILLAKKA